jgi:uncharacterized membrane protein
MENSAADRPGDETPMKEGGPFVRSGSLGRSRSDVNLWRMPLGFSLAGFTLFGLTMIPDVLDARGVIHLPEWFTMGGIDDARAILSAMLGSVCTVLALIFSVALLVLSMVATLFGPRLLYRFLQDWVTQATIGLFMATFIFLCLVFLVTHQNSQSTFIPQVSLITSWLLVIASFGFLIYYSHRIAASIQNPDMIARIVDDLRLLDTVRRMTPRMQTEVARQALMAQADAVREAASTKVLVKLDRDDVEAAWHRARPVAEACSVSA